MEIGPLSGILERSAVPDLAAVVDHLALRGEDEATAAAAERIKDAIERGSPPPGIRLLTEAMVAAARDRDRPPSPRRPGDDPAAVVTEARTTSFVVLEEFGAEAVAAVVAGLVQDGRRVVVTADDAAELSPVRAAIPPAVAAYCLDTLPVLPPATLRRLRHLLATATPLRPGRARQRVPTADAVPSITEVTELCRRAARGGGPRGPVGPASSDPVVLVPELLAGLESDRRLAVTAAAQHVERTLAALRNRRTEPWVWSLLSDLAHSRRWTELEHLMELASRTVALAEELESAPRVSLPTPLPADGRALLTRYREFLEAGGRRRTVFRSSLQREVEPLLERVRVGDHSPETAEEIALVLRAVELTDRLAELRSACRALDVPAPSAPGAVAGMVDVLHAVAAAARAVAALRREVLFLRPELPIAIPDVPAAERIAAAIREYGGQDSPAVAARALRRMADVLESVCPPDTAAPELARAVAALRAHDADAYRAAVTSLAAARREILAAQELAEHLALLAERAPTLAEALAASCGDGPVKLGFAAFVPTEQLLGDLPPPDSADVVVVLGTHRLGVERLLLAAVAPRMVGVVGTSRAARDRRTGHTVASVLQALSALVIRGPGHVVPLPTHGVSSRRGTTGRGAADRAGA